MILYDIHSYIILYRTGFYILGILIIINEFNKYIWNE